MLKNGLKLFIELYCEFFYKSLENYLIIYYNILKTTFFDNFSRIFFKIDISINFLRHQNYKNKNKKLRQKTFSKTG